MADAKITALETLANTAIAAGDWLPIVDVSDTSMAASGTTKKVSANDVAMLGKTQTFTAPQSIVTGESVVLLLTRTAQNPTLSFSDGTNSANLAFRVGTGLGTNMDFAPLTNDAYDLGTSSYKWDDVYATNGTIQTSDAREKLDVIDSSLGLAFVNALRAVQYRWRDGVRPHQGLLAQEVKATMDAQGIADFGGYVYDKESDQYGIRYSEFVAPLIRAVQELTQRVMELENQIGSAQSGRGA